MVSLTILEFFKEIAKIRREYVWSLSKLITDNDELVEALENSEKEYHKMNKARVPRKVILKTLANRSKVLGVKRDRIRNMSIVKIMEDFLISEGYYVFTNFSKGYKVNGYGGDNLTDMFPSRKTTGNKEYELILETDLHYFKPDQLWVAAYPGKSFYIEEMTNDDHMLPFDKMYGPLIITNKEKAVVLNEQDKRITFKDYSFFETYWERT